MSLIAKKIQEVRIHKGYNKSQMARELGIVSQLYGQYESGEVQPKIKFYEKFEEKFQINLLSNEKLSFGACEQCIEKERTIAALQLAIESMQSNIKTLQMIVENNNNFTTPEMQKKVG